MDMRAGMLKTLDIIRPNLETVFISEGRIPGIETQKN
jgi:hypothetical protein